MDTQKPSYKTLEFWLSVAAMVVGALMASDVFAADSKMLQIAGMVSTILGGLGYTAARTFQKNGELKAKTLMHAADKGSGAKPNP